MSEQRHRIQRQILEVRIPNPDNTQAFYDTLRRIYDNRIVPMIDQLCSEYCHPDQIIRLDTITLDLGHLDLLHLEEALVLKCQMQLRKKLSDEIHRQSQESGQNTGKPFSQLELFEFFARTGRLPWWADAANRKLLSQNLKDLIAQVPNPLIRLMQMLVREPAALDRMIYQYDDASLSTLCRLRLQSTQVKLDVVLQDLQALMNVSPELMRVNQEQVVSSRRIRVEYWRAILTRLFAKSDQKTAPFALWPTVFTRLARNSRLSDSEFIGMLKETLKVAAPSRHAGIVSILENIPKANFKKKTKIPDKHSVKPTLSRRSPLMEEIMEILEGFRQSGAYLESLYAPFVELLSSLSEDAYPAWLRQLKEINVSKAGIVLEDEKIKERLREMLQTLHTRHAVPAPLIHQSLAAIEENTLTYPLEKPLSETDVQYVENAGLVLLWPFLSHFFKHLGLTEENQFINGEALQRGIALLHYLVFEENEPAEYDLVLNRILCGMDLDRVFTLEKPITENEAEECSQLIKAVITQIPILKKMSVSGFRGTFLIRKGVLSQGDGVWLLRIERTTFDVILDHFPWGMNWIKLPWMTIPIQVEW